MRRDYKKRRKHFLVIHFRTILFPLFLWSILALGAEQASIPGRVRVLACGHSFLLAPLKFLPPMAKTAAVPYEGLDAQILAGSKVIDLWNVPEADNRAKTSLRTGSVDVLILSPHFEVPDRGIELFTRLGLEKNPNLRVLVQVSWPAYDGVLDRRFRNRERDSDSVESLQKAEDDFRRRWTVPLDAQILALNRSIGRNVVSVIPTADAVFEFRRLVAAGKVPGIERQSELFIDDTGHPKPVLAVLAAYCDFIAIYHCSPVGFPVPDELRGMVERVAVTRILQDTAWRTRRGI